MVNQPFKVCPQCGQNVTLPVQTCGRCGHAFRTQFTPDDQTMAFGASPAIPQFHSRRAKSKRLLIPVALLAIFCMFAVFAAIGKASSGSKPAAQIPIVRISWKSTSPQFSIANVQNIGTVPITDGFVLVHYDVPIIQSGFYTGIEARTIGPLRLNIIKSTGYTEIPGGGIMGTQSQSSTILPGQSTPVVVVGVSVQRIKSLEVFSAPNRDGSGPRTPIEFEEIVSPFQSN